MAFVIGGVAGWMARGASAAAPSAVALFTSDAIEAHKLYIGEVRHPIEVKAEEDHLLPWLSRRVGTTLRAPDLGAFGLKLLGGRLLPGVSGPAALFMYEGANGERFTIYCSRLDAARTAFRYDANDSFGAVHWIEGSYGWVVSGPKDKDKLKAVASAAYDQLENRTPRAVAGRGRSAHVAARIVGLAVAPLLHQFLELGVAALGQHDADRGVEIAGAVLAGQALAFDAERAARSWCRAEWRAPPRRRASAREPCRRAPLHRASPAVPAEGSRRRA